jgi:hypothetical protein
MDLVLFGYLENLGQKKQSETIFFFGEQWVS